MKYIIYTIFLLAVLAVNIEISGWFAATPVRLNLLLLTVIFSALEKEEFDFLFVAFISGLLLDFYGSAPFGSFLFSFLIISWVVNWAARTFWVYELNVKTTASFTALSLFFTQIVVWVFARILPKIGFSLPALNFFETVQTFFYSLAAYLPISVLMYFLWKKTRSWVLTLENKSIILK